MAIYISEAPIKLPYAYNYANIFASGVPSITIEDEWLIKHELISYTAFDATRFTASNQDIQVSNDLNEQSYKIRMEFLPFLNGNVGEFESKIDLGSFSSIPNSAELKYSQNILMNKLPVIVSNLTLGKTGNGFDILPDFNPVGSANYNAVGYLNGSQVSSNSNFNGNTSIKNLNGMPWQNTPIMGVKWGVNTISIVFYENIRVKFKNGPWTEVNEIIFSAVSSNINYSEFAFIDLLSTNIDSYTLKDGQYSNSVSARYASSIQEASSDARFFIFPNPTTNTLFINSSSIKNIRIVDVNGKTMDASLINNQHNNFSVDVSAFSEGIYFITIDNGISKESKKFIVTK